MQCPYCQYQADYAFKFCPECGQPANAVPGQDSQDNESPGQDSQSGQPPVQDSPGNDPPARDYHDSQAGQPLPHDHDQADQQRLQAERLAFVNRDLGRTAYVRDDYDPGRDGRFRMQPVSSAMPVQPLPAPAAQTAGAGSPVAWADTAGKSGPRPSSTGNVIMAIINMLCCGFGISMILGLIALVFAIQASSERTADEAVRKLGTARTLNIIGLAFVAIQIIAIVLVVVLSIAFASGSWSFGPSGFGDYPMG